MQRCAAIAIPTGHPFDELLAHCKRNVSGLVEEFNLAGPAIPRPLKFLRPAGLAAICAERQSLIQAFNPKGFGERDEWIEKIRNFWSRHLDALERELRTDDEKKPQPEKKNS